MKTTVLFVCVHNAGRSQMAAGYLRHLGGDTVTVLSAGSMPGDQEGRTHELGERSAEVHQVSDPPSRAANPSSASRRTR